MTFTSEAAANRDDVHITGIKRKLNFRPLIVDRDVYEGKTPVAQGGEVNLKSPARVRAMLLDRAVAVNGTTN